MSELELANTFELFLPECIVAVPRKNQDKEIIYWSIRYKESANTNNLLTVPIGTFRCVEEKIYITLLSCQEIEKRILDQVRVASRLFANKHPEHYGNIINA